MTEKEIEIFEMIDAGCSLNEISYKLWLSSRQVHQKIIKLKNEGYFIRPIYYDDGEIKYDFEEDNSNHTINIKLCNDFKFKALVISDIHIGNTLENLSYLYKAYDYARDHDIHIIFNCGDIIDGSFTKGTQNIFNIDGQIDKVINNYPHDNYILNFICFGNHDYCSNKYGRDISLALSNSRQDLISAGYEFSLINVEKDQFALYHPINEMGFKSIPNKLILEGHHHKMLVKIKRNNYFINVPSLSDLCFGNQENAGMLEMELLFGGGFIHNAFFKQIGVKNNFEVYSEFNIEFFLKHEKLDEKKLILK